MISQKNCKSYQCKSHSLWAGGIIGPYFFKDAANRNVTVNGERRDMIPNFFLPKMQELDLHDMWFQQDGATCQTARITMYLLSCLFGEHFISRSAAVNWPPRPRDLKPLVYSCRYRQARFN